VEGQSKKLLLQKASIFLLPSYHEGHPNVVLEAMAASIPVIASDVGCVAETVEDGVGGFVIEPGNIGQLITKINQLLGDEILWRNMGQAAQARIRANYPLKATVESLRITFSELLNEG
jgi:glycosyltransferase involved in cell wall biosynthesis